MDQVLSARDTIPELDTDVFTLNVDLAMECAEEDMISNPAVAAADNMTVDEVAAIKMFTMTVEPPTTAFYYLLNKALREEDRAHVKPFVKILWLLMQAMRKALPVVYRGVKGDLSATYRKG
eukprot:gene42203-biopygen11048